MAFDVEVNALESRVFVGDEVVEGPLDLHQSGSTAYGLLDWLGRVFDGSLHEVWRRFYSLVFKTAKNERYAAAAVRRRHRCSYDIVIYKIYKIINKFRITSLKFIIKTEMTISTKILPDMS